MSEEELTKLSTEQLYALVDKLARSQTGSGGVMLLIFVPEGTEVIGAFKVTQEMILGRLEKVVEEFKAQIAAKQN